ncbi:hypothetical protein RF55_13875 [Lasius niger]|uniref:Uncharacterized protein n=1 Tax=Lasius niger TaxID=67767 RepID=A0A0J7N2T5_LASNI|nr:hypothetical protein RF55_13875 [Lasius niger]
MDGWGEVAAPRPHLARHGDQPSSAEGSISTGGHFFRWVTTSEGKRSRSPTGGPADPHYPPPEPSSKYVRVAPVAKSTGPSSKTFEWPRRPPPPESAGPSGMSNSTGMAPPTLMWDAAFPDARPRVASHASPRHPGTGTHVPPTMAMPWAENAPRREHPPRRSGQRASLYPTTP